MGLSALVQTMPSGGATRTRSDAAICASPSGAGPLPRGSRSGGATRTRHPFHAGLAVLSARAQTVPRTRPTLPHRQAFLSSFGTASRRCSDGCLTRVMTLTRRQASPGLGGGPTVALLRSFSQAEFTSPSPFWRLMED